METWSDISFKSAKTAGSARSGYALVVVLFSLVVLTLIFGAASTRTMTHIQRIQTDRLVAERFEENAAIAELVLTFRPQTQTDTDAQVWQVTQLRGVALQPATGLVDLNTASPTLLRMLLEGYNLTEKDISSALENYRRWRREGRKLLRVSDFRRITGLSSEKLPDIERLATVYSGRTGVAVKQVPPVLASHLLWTNAEISGVDKQLDPRVITPGSVVNQHFVKEDRLLGAIHLGGGVSGSRILQMW